MESYLSGEKIFVKHQFWSCDSTA
ncbi:DUF5951 family protein [Kluyvera sp. 142486]